MADTTALKNRIRAAIKANDNQEITGPVLQQALLDIVDELNGATETEANTRQNGDTALQQNITAEKNRAEGAEGTLQQNINTEAEARQQGDTQLNNLITGIKNNIDNGYVYAGIATPSTTPVTGKVFYLALIAGTYTDFDNLTVTQGINILKYNGSTWSSDAFIGIDDEPTAGSDNLVKSGGVKLNVVELSGRISNQYSRKIPYDKVGYYQVSASGISLTSDESAGNSGIVRLKGINTLKVKASIASNYYSVIFLDIEQKPILDISLKGTRDVTIDLTSSDYDDAYYFIVQQYGSIYTALCFVYCADDKYDYSSIQDVNYSHDLSLSKVGYVRNDSYSISSDANARNTGLIFIGNYTKLKYKAGLSNQGLEIAFYDAAKAPLRDICIVGNNDINEVTIDLTQSAYQDAVYFIVSAYSSQQVFSNFYAKLYDDTSINSTDIRNIIENGLHNDAIVQQLGKNTGKVISQKVVSENLITIDSRIDNQYSKEVHIDKIGYYQVSASGITLTPDTNARNTGIIKLKGINTLNISSSIGANYYSVVFLDIEQKPILDISLKGNQQDITIDLSNSDYDDAYYFIVQHYSAYGSYCIAYCADNRYDFNSIQNSSIDNILSFSEIGYIHGTTCRVQADTDARNTGLVYIKGYTKLKYGGMYLSSLGYVVIFYDIAMKPLKSISVLGAGADNEGIIDLIQEGYEDAVYCIVSGYSTDHAAFSNFYARLYNDTCLDREDLTNIGINESYALDEVGYLNAYSHIITDDKNARHTDYIEVKVGQKLECKTSISSAGYGLAFFDESKELLSDISIAGSVDIKDYSVPSGAKYIMVSKYGTSSPGYIYISNIKKYYGLSKVDIIDNITPIDVNNPLAHINLYPGFAALFTEWGFIGDSLSSGNLEVRTAEDPSYNNHDFPEFSWCQYMCRLTGASGFNFSTGGRTALSWLNGTTERDWRNGAKLNPKRNYTIALCANDTEDVGSISDIGTYDPATDTDTNGNTFAGHYAGIIQRLKSVSPKCKIFVLTLPKRHSDKDNYNAIIRQMATVFDNVYVIDLYTYSVYNSAWTAKYQHGYHLQTVGYLYCAYEIMTYIDWIVRNNPVLFGDEALIGTDWLPL